MAELDLDGTPLCVLTVHAHPDDEASKGAPTLARYHAEGVRTVLVCCTGGEEGELQNPSLREPGQPFHGLEPEQEKALLTDLRPQELARSAEVIGFDEVIMLGYRDSGMPGTPGNDDPASFHQAPFDEAVGRLVAAIRRTRPQVIITYNDDQEGYPHPDHLKVHDISGPAFERAGDPDVVPRAGRAVAAAQALLHGLEPPPPRSPSTRRSCGCGAPRPTTRSGSTGRTTTIASRRRSPSRATCGPGPSRCGPTPRRSTRASRSGSGCPTRS